MISVNKYLVSTVTEYTGNVLQLKSSLCVMMFPRPRILECTMETAPTFKAGSLTRKTTQNYKTTRVRAVVGQV